MHSTNNILISIGCNKHCEAQMTLAKECLSKTFPGITFTASLVSPAYGMPADVAPYSNMLAEGTTDMDVDTLTATLKALEQSMGDSSELRRQHVVMMDLDLLQYGGQRHHPDDWHKPYIVQLLTRLMTLLLFVALSMPVMAKADKHDAELLGKAIEYFQSGKYHESVLAFEKLRRTYTLTPRFMAYLGMSYYKDQQYKQAVECLQQSLPHLESYSPKERAVYTYYCAESLFQLERYEDSIHYYEQALPLVTGNDRGDVLFHNAFAHYFLHDPADKVIGLLSEALELYKANTDTATSLQASRMQQTERMLKGLRKSNAQVAVHGL